MTLVKSASPTVEQIVNGWAAIGDGWAVHAPTKEEVIEKFNERKKYYDWLDSQPIKHILLLASLSVSRSLS